MADRDTILQAYQAEIARRWKKGYMNPKDVRALKLFCQTCQITVAEHNQVASLSGLNARELMDEENQLFNSWLEKQRAPVTAANGGLMLVPQSRNAWKNKLPVPPTQQHNVMAGVALAALVICVLIILL